MNKNETRNARKYPLVPLFRFLAAASSLEMAGLYAKTFLATPRRDCNISRSEMLLQEARLKVNFAPDVDVEVCFGSIPHPVYWVPQRTIESILLYGELTYSSFWLISHAPHP